MKARSKTAKRIAVAVVSVILTAAMTLGGSVNAASALQWALEPTEVYKSIYHAGGDYWLRGTATQGHSQLPREAESLSAWARFPVTQPR